MIRLTRAGEYAVRGMFFLAQQGEGLTLISDIARAQGCSSSFLAKIFQSLVKAGLADSQRGVSGGVSLGRRPGEINLKQIIEAVEGPIAINRCLLPDQPCRNTRLCRLARVWSRAQRGFLDVLEQATLLDLLQTPPSDDSPWLHSLPSKDGPPDKDETAHGV